MENAFQDTVPSSDSNIIPPKSMQIEQTIPTSSKIQTNLETLFPTRNQIGTVFKISETYQDSDSIWNGKTFQTLKKSYDNSFLITTISLTKFDSGKEALDYYQEVKSASYEQGGFKYFPVSVVGATCYSERNNFNSLLTGYCVKDNIYFLIKGEYDYPSVSKWAQYVIDNFENS